MRVNFSLAATIVAFLLGGQAEAPEQAPRQQEIDERIVEELYGWIYDAQSGMLILSASWVPYQPHEAFYGYSQRCSQFYDTSVLLRENRDFLIRLETVNKRLQERMRGLGKLDLEQQVIPTLEEGMRELVPLLYAHGIVADLLRAVPPPSIPITTVPPPLWTDLGDNLKLIKTVWGDRFPPTVPFKYCGGGELRVSGEAQYVQAHHRLMSPRGGNREYQRLFALLLSNFPKRVPDGNTLKMAELTAALKKEALQLGLGTYTEQAVNFSGVESL